MAVLGGITVSLLELLVIVSPVVTLVIGWILGVRTERENRRRWAQWN